ncbi:MAG: amino acid ABC transporter substrate-binding protein [Alphaproteobacteria bacterium]|nr:amino acid ABC transporter substrate-binding protein [Alphaproteobacteria bacterium]
MKKLILSLCVMIVFAAPAQAGAEEGGAYERMQQTAKLRCGYALWDPALIKDPETGEMTGAFVEFMNALGKATGLEIEWTQETDWGQVPEALKTGKIDAMCASMWPSSKKARVMAFSDPVYYNVVEAYVREGHEKLAGKSLADLNDENITIAVIDNDIADEIADFDFPKAQKLSAPTLVTDAHLLMDVATGKADVTFTSEAIAIGFRENNPGKIVRFVPAHPVRVFENTIGVDIHEYELLQVLNAATAELLNSGVVDRILDRYEKDYPGSFRRVSKPYEASK